MKKILISEDEDVMRSMLIDFLTMYDYEIIEAENGKIAWNLWQLEKPDLVISDVNMPVMSGIELLREIKKQDVNFPVIIITGVSIEKAKQEASEYHADAFLSKPFKMKELILCIQSLIE